MEVHSLSYSSENISSTSTSRQITHPIQPAVETKQAPPSSPRISSRRSNAVHRWLWHNTSNEKSVSDSFNLQTETFYFIRQICFAISLITWTMSQLESKSAILTNFQYLTEWGVDLSVIYFGMTLRIMKSQKFAEKYWKIAHVIFEVIYSAEFIITAMFWGAIYSTITREKTVYYITLTTLEHGGIFLLLIIDNCFNRIKFYKRHLIYLLTFVLAYLGVNLIVTIFHEPVYSIIDWKSKGSHIFAGIALVSTLLHFCCARIIYDCFKKKRVERPYTIDDFFFTEKPIEIAAFQKLLERRYVWWGLVLTISSLAITTIVETFLPEFE